MKVIPFLIFSLFLFSCRAQTNEVATQHVEETPQDNCENDILDFDTTKKQFTFS